MTMGLKPIRRYCNAPDCLKHAVNGGWHCAKHQGYDADAEDRKLAARWDELTDPSEVRRAKRVIFG